MNDKNYPNDGLNNSKKISSSPFTEKIDRIKRSFRDYPDFVGKKVQLANGQMGYYLFLETMASPEEVSQNLIKPLLAMDPSEASISKLNQNPSIGTLIDNPDDASLTNTILSGSVILMPEGEDYETSPNRRPKKYSTPT